MTSAHLLFALATTIYILAAIQLEERDLVSAFGERYVEYRRRTPMLVPRLWAGPRQDGPRQDAPRKSAAPPPAGRSPSA